MLGIHTRHTGHSRPSPVPVRHGLLLGLLGLYVLLHGPAEPGT